MSINKRQPATTGAVRTIVVTCLLTPLQAVAAEPTHEGGLDWNQIIAFAFIGLVIGAVIAFFNRNR
ncbi:MAG TPA: hypothetical protein VFJ15_13435 [Oleiagrimonas sp.]|nr:hypothetical protein [Oleiagrimonas sp.]